MNETNKSTLTITPQGENLNEIVEWIKTMQVRGMKFPPKKDNYYVDLGLFFFTTNAINQA